MARVKKSSPDDLYREQVAAYMKDRTEWRKRQNAEAKMLREFPAVKVAVDDLGRRFDQHLEDEKAEREKDRADRDKRQADLDAKLDAILDIKSKAVFLWRVAKIVGGITIGILTFLKLIMPFLRPAMESWIRHLKG